MKHGHDKDFLEKCRNIDFSSESKNYEENLEMLKTKLSNKDEKGIIHMNKKFKRPIAVAACFIAVLAISTAAFGQDVMNYLRITMLGEHVTFVVSAPEETTSILVSKDGENFISLDRDEMKAFLEDGGILYLEDGSTLVICVNTVAVDWLTFTDVQEGKSHFITDEMLPTYTPDGFSFKHIFYFVETLEELQEYGANMYMGIVFSDGINEISIQMRYMTEETGFTMPASEYMRTIEINGNEAMLDGNTLSILIGDVLYRFLGHRDIDADELIKMAESLR